jgi:hypothetical protein
MDYAYFSAPQQPYHHFMGMSSQGFPRIGVESDNIRSVVRFLGMTNPSNLTAYYRSPSILLSSRPTMHSRSTACPPHIRAHLKALQHTHRWL